MEFKQLQHRNSLKTIQYGKIYFAKMCIYILDVLLKCLNCTIFNVYIHFIVFLTYLATARRRRSSHVHNFQWEK